MNMRITNPAIKDDDIDRLQQLAESLSEAAKAAGVNDSFSYQKAAVCLLAEQLDPDAPIDSFLIVARKIVSTVRGMQYCRSKGINDTGQELVSIANGDIDQEMAKRLLMEGQLTSPSAAFALIITYPHLSNDIFDALDKVQPNVREMLGWNPNKTPKEELTNLVRGTAAAGTA